MTFKMMHRQFGLLLTLLMLGSCGSHMQATGAPVVNIPAARYMPAPATVSTVQPTRQAQTFAQCIVAFKQEEHANGISQPVLDTAFSDVNAPLEDVLLFDRKQPENTQTFDTYLKNFLTQKRLDAAEDQWDSHAGILAEVQKTYGVPIPILLALWQTESRFGEHQGNFSIVAALATLACDGRRSAFFRKELMNTMIMLEREHMDPHQLTGSWAGAMGQVQFMPSSFLAFAVDFDGDGKKDIWNSDADALASMSNYLSSKGWDSHIGWGVHVRVPEGADVQGWVDSKATYTIRQWQKMGLRRADGKKLPHMPGELRLVMPDSDPANAYLVTRNYDVIMDWNHSVYFATAIGLQADAIARAHSQ